MKIQTDYTVSIFPMGADFDNYSDNDIKYAMNSINDE